MEDYEAQELEFWRKLDEDGMSRSQMLKRSVAAATGLTVLSSSGMAWARERGIRAAPPLKGSSISMSELVATAKKEGGLNTIALPPDWANYGEIMSTFTKKYGIKISNSNPDGSSARGEPGRAVAQGRLACAGRRRRRPRIRDLGNGPGAVREVLRHRVLHHSAGDEGHPRLLDRRLLGRNLDRLQLEPRQPCTEDVEGPPQPGLQGQGRAQREPAHVGVGSRRRLLRRARERRLAQRRRPRDRLLRNAEEVGQLHPGAVDAADGGLRSDADLDRLGLPEPRVREGVPGGELEGHGSVRRRLRRVLLPGDQRERSASVHGSPVGGVPLLGPGAAALAEGLLAPGALPGPREAQGDPEQPADGSAGRGHLRKGEVRKLGQQTAAKAKIATDWPAKVGA